MKTKAFKIFAFILVMIMILSTFSACGEGTSGPAGPQGEQGIQGKKGDTGAQGPQGEQGPSGITPQLKIGEDNYWYVSYDNGTTWANLNVKATGADGEQGPQGETGATGPAGITPQLKVGEDNYWYVSYNNGTTWANLNVKATGTDGEQGDNGPQGLSAYDIFIKYHPHYQGTEKQWIDDVANGNIKALFNEEHTYDEGVIEQNPAPYVEGILRYTCIYCGYTYTEKIDPIIPAEKEIYEVDGVRYIDFGKYPQTRVNDTALIEILSKITTLNENGYIEYDGTEYQKLVVKKFSSTGIVSKNCFHDGTPIQNGDTHYFEVQPIRWRILSEKEEDYYVIIADKLLSNEGYTNVIYSFEEKAFDENDLLAIKNINEENGKVNAANVSEMTNGGLSLSTRVAKVTDYALALGAYAGETFIGQYWTDSSEGLTIKDTGAIGWLSGTYYSFDGNYVSTKLDGICIRPLCIIVLNKCSENENGK